MDWDAVQNIHPKAMVCSLPLGEGQNFTEDECRGDISIHRSHSGHVLYTCVLQAGVSSYSKFHSAKLEDHLESSGKEEGFKCRISKKLLNKINLLDRISKKLLEKIIMP
jgi:hypothetical protein